jgi:CheY-like chemotaxis protein
VLCVDDEPDVLRGLKRILGTEFRIVTADDPIAALSLLEQDHDFSVVIADVRMPRMDGGEFLTRAKSLSPMTTRLALTGCVEWDPADTHPSDIFERLTKPCPVDRLHASVMAAAKQHSLLTSLPEPLKRLCTSISATHGGSLDDFGAGVVLPPPSSDVPLVHTLGELSAGRRIALRMFDRDVEILPGITVLGRSKMCNIIVNDPRISRRHACFTFNGRELTVEDVSSTNGLLVNGRPVQGVQRLSINDRLTIGPLTVDVCGMSTHNTSFEPTMRLATGETGRRERQGSGAIPGAMPIVMGVAEKALFLGENRHAERIVRPLLENLLWRCEDGHDGPPRDEVDAAIGFALRLAEASGSGEWIDYVFRLYTSLRQPLPPVLIERLYSLLRTTTGVSSVLFRHYLSALRTIGDRLGPADQFLVRRIKGLEPLILAQSPFAG